MNETTLLETIQQAGLRYVWDFAHPVSGLVRERSNGDQCYIAGHDHCSIGATGMGVMAIIVGAENGWIKRIEAAERIKKILLFLSENTDCYHGALSHFYHGETGKQLRFMQKDDGADIVETAYFMQGILAARQYFHRSCKTESDVRSLADRFWHAVNWRWFTKDGGEQALCWHWSPNNGFDLNHHIRGWDECLIVYLLAASAPNEDFRITPDVYHEGWARNGAIANGNAYYGIHLPLGHDWDPLFFVHYSMLGFDPRGASDDYCSDYFEQCRAHTLIQRAYAIENPLGWKGYGSSCWGFSESDGIEEYFAHGASPDRDRGIVTSFAPTCSLAYTPDESMEVINHLWFNLKQHLWGDYGFKDAFSLSHRDEDGENTIWCSDTYIGKNVAPQVVAIENYRTGLLWDLVMSVPELRQGMQTLRFKSPHF